MMDNNQQEILQRIGTEIAKANSVWWSEYSAPGFNADNSDDKVKLYGDKVAMLRSIREQLENEFVKV